MALRAALYVRVSTDQQAERYSLPAQKRLLAEHCERQDYTFAFYEDAGISGETIEARPAMRRLIEDILARRVDIVLAVEMERFSRSRDGVDLALFKRVCREAGVRFGTPAQLFNPEDVEDDFVSGLLGLLASREKQKIVERTSRGRVEAARRGKPVFAVCPFGYHRSPEKQIVPNEREAEAVRFMFRRLAAGRSLYGIVDDLNARGFRPRQAARWTRGSVWSILRNPAYGGAAVYRRTKTSTSGRVLRPESEWVSIPLPRIVSADLVRIAHDRLQRNAQMSARNQRHFWLLRGIVFCAVCGHLMSGRISEGRWRYYTCQQARSDVRGLRPRCRYHAVTADALESWAWDQIVRALRTPALVLEEARRTREARLGERDELEMRLAYLDKALQGLPQERERIISTFREGYISKDDLRAQLAGIEQKRTALLDERMTLHARLGVQAVDETQTEQIEKVVARVRGRLDRLTDMERYEAIHALTGRIGVHPSGRIEIDACVPLGERQAVAVRVGEELSTVSTTW